MHVLDVAAVERAPAPSSYFDRLSARYTDLSDLLTGRADVTVRVYPGRDGTPPGQFLRRYARIEADGALVPKGFVEAEFELDPARVDHRGFMPVLHGVVCHEAGHAAHTRWTAPEGTPARVVDAMGVLEEPRMEAQHLRRRPQDRPWLRAAAEALLVDDEPFPDTKAGAARAAALVLGRVDAGVLDPREALPLTDTLLGIIGALALAPLRQVWKAVLSLADGDSSGLLAAAEHWCELVGEDEAPEEGAPGGGDGASQVGDAVAQVAEDVARCALGEVPELLATGNAVGQDVDSGSSAEDDEAEAAEAQAKAAFEEHNPFRLGWSFRAPTAAEMRAAALITQELSRARYRERTVTVVRDFLPPGRLDLRAAVSGAIERGAGRVASRPEWKQTRRHRVDQPPLCAGIIIDTSGSMKWAREPMASAGWEIHTAVYRSGGQAAMLTYGGQPRCVYGPGQHPRRVVRFKTGFGDERFCEAVDAVDFMVGLTAVKGGARLLVVVSDGQYTISQRRGGERRVQRLLRAGCHILWLDFRPGVPLFSGVERVVLDDPARAGKVIGAELRHLLEAA